MYLTNVMEHAKPGSSLQNEIQDSGFKIMLYYRKRVSLAFI